MSEQINFNDNDLQSAIIDHYKNQGVSISEPTANQICSEIRSKMKNNTMDEFKMAIKEIQLQLSPSESSLKDSLNNHLKILRSMAFSSLLLIKKSDSFEGMKNEEVKNLFAELTEMAKKSGLSIQEQKKELDRLIDNIDRKRRKIDEDLKHISDFDFTANNKEIEDMTRDKELANITKQEYDVLEKARASKIPESKKVNYTKEQENYLNKKLSPVKKDKNGNNILIFNKIPTINEGNVGGERSNERLLWTKKRFAYEKAMNRENTPLYQKRLAQYQAYVYLKKEELLALTKERASLDRIRTIARNQQTINEHFRTRAVEFYHSKPINQKMYEEISSMIKKYKNDIMEEIRYYEESSGKYFEAQTRLNELEKMFANASEWDELKPAPVKEESAQFDPDYLHGLSRKQRTEDSPGFRQESRLPPNVWNVEGENGELLKNKEITWSLGQSIYYGLDKPTKENSDDARTILTMSADQLPKISQSIKVSPYASPEQKQNFVNRLEMLPKRGLSEETKERLASNPRLHWNLLWNLSKKNIDRDMFLKELGFSDKVSLNDKDEEFTKHIFRQLPSINSLAVRSLVIENKGTPDWILMYSSENSNDTQTLAIKQLGLRGYKLKKDEKGNPVISNQSGNWVWEKTNRKTSNLIFSPRESQMNNPNPDPQMQSLLEQKRQLDQQNQKSNAQSQSLDQQISQRQTILDQQKALTQPQNVHPVQAPDLSNVPKPAMPSPVAVY